MRLLLDTHVVIWWLTDASQLPPAYNDLLRDTTHVVHVSAASCWEIGIKVRAGKWPEAAAFVPGLPAKLAIAKLLVLSVTGVHAERAALLDIAHKDPFDRLLAAQALEEGLTLVSVDPVFKRVAGLTVL